MAKSHMLIMQESYLKGYANWTAFEEVWKKLDFLVYQQTAVANARKAPLQPLGTYLYFIKNILKREINLYSPPKIAITC
jgi:hypothetical protein